ncbi:MAG: YwiC-like family protein [Acidobacteriota bacterium]
MQPPRRPESPPTLWPREHGAISMLVQPLICALPIVGHWHWSFIPTAIVAAAIFLVREPLVVLCRQRWVWRDPHPEAQMAKRWLAILIPFILLNGGILLLRWQRRWLYAFAAGSVVLTAYALWMTIRNRQRSIWLQCVSSVGLTSTGLAGILSLNDGLAPWAWWLWLLSAAQAAAGILVVHALLEARIAAKTSKPETVEFFRAAVAAQALLLPLAVLAYPISPWLNIAMLLPAAVHAYELLTLRSPESLTTPLRTIGFRAMALSIAVSLLLIAGLR